MSEFKNKINRLMLGYHWSDSEFGQELEELLFSYRMLDEIRNDAWKYARYIGFYCYSIGCQNPLRQQDAIADAPVRNQVSPVRKKQPSKTVRPIPKKPSKTVRPLQRPVPTAFDTKYLNILVSNKILFTCKQHQVEPSIIGSKIQQINEQIVKLTAQCVQQLEENLREVRTLFVTLTLHGS